MGPLQTRGTGTAAGARFLQDRGTRYPDRVLNARCPPAWSDPMRLLALLFCLLLGACSTTSTVRQAPEVVAGRTYALAFVNEGGDDAEGIAALERAIRSRLDAAGLLGASGNAARLEVTLTHYYVRSNGARFWAGIMAGRDKIISRVRIVGPDGR